MSAELQADARVVRDVLEAWRDELTHEFDIELAERASEALDRLVEAAGMLHDRVGLLEIAADNARRAETFESALRRIVDRHPTTPIGAHPAVDIARAALGDHRAP